jgi:predicted Holliday junction resolvase-like endonuclease
MEDFFIFIVLAVILVLIYVAYRFGLHLGRERSDHHWQEQIPELRKDAIKQSRAVLGGQFSEQLAPYLPNFPYSPTEVRFIGKPMDFLVFKGMDEKNISEVIFVEVKSARSKLTPHEQRLKETISSRRVRWEEYRIPEEITREKSN